MRSMLLAVVLLVAGCSSATPAATPSPAPPVSAPTAAPSPSAAPTSAPTSTAAPTSSDNGSCDPDMGYGCYTAAPTVATDGIVISTAESGEFGTYLVAGVGLALYTNANDTADHSSCTGGCADNWPPLIQPVGETQVIGTDGVDGTFGQVQRDDGSTQVTYNGFPLYHFAGDNAPGDTNGQGISDVWFLAAP